MAPLAGVVFEAQDDKGKGNESIKLEKQQFQIYQ